MSKRKILQIMPAPGWAAIFSEGDEELISPLVGWALVHDDAGAPAVVGLAAADKVELCEDQANFLRYAFVSELIDDDDEMIEFEDFEDDDEEDEDDDLGLDLDFGADDESFDPTKGLLN